MKRIFLILSLIGLTAGCHAQLPVSPAPTVALAWTAPTSGCPSCTYVLSRVTVTSGTACPSSGYAQIGTTAANVLTFTDATPPQGVNVCYIVQAQTVSTPVLTGAASAPSNSGAVLTIPAVPTAPGAPTTTTTAKDVQPQTAPAVSQQLASAGNPPINLKARLVR